MQTSFRHVAIAAMAMTTVGGIASISPALVPGADAASEAQIRSVLERHPDLVLAALNTLQQRQEKVQGAKLLATAGPVSEAIIAGDDQVAFLGNPRGQAIVEFFDYNCGFCKRFASDTAAPLLQTSRNVKLILVQTPILGAGSQRMAEFAAAARMQGQQAFYRAHEFLIAQHATTLESAEALRPQLVKSAELDQAAFDRAIADGSAKAVVDHNARLAQKAGVTGTPLIYVNGHVSAGAIDLAPLKAYLS